MELIVYFFLQLIYLDPHVCQAAIDLDERCASLQQQDGFVEVSLFRTLHFFYLVDSFVLFLHSLFFFYSHFIFKKLVSVKLKCFGFYNFDF